MLFVCNAFLLHATRPTMHSSGLSYNNLNCDKVQLNWTQGNGNMRVIVAHEGSMPTYVPPDGETFSADPKFGGSIEYDAPNKNFIVYNGTGTNYVIVTGLLPGKTYYFVIYEHDNNGTSTEYYTTGAPSISVTTYNVNLDFKSYPIDSCQMTNSFRFRNLSSSAIPGITYKFDFGNCTSTDTNVVHHFNSAGYVNVNLYAITSLTGCPSLVVKNVKIFQKKVAFIDYSLFNDTQCLENNLYTLQTKPIIGQFPLSCTYKWWFADGDSTTFPKVKKKYKISGTFNAGLELTVMSYSQPTNCKDTVRFVLTVLPSPVGNISINDTFQCLKYNKYVFTNPDTTLTVYKWYFGDNDSSWSRIDSHRYKNTGTYKVIHVAFANTGCKGRDTIDVTVLPNLNSGFSGLDTFYCASNTIRTLLPVTKSGQFFGYPTIGDTLISNTVGSHTLTHIVRDAYCADTSAQTFRIAPTPNPKIGNDTAICSASSYTLKANETGTYLWTTGQTTSAITVSATGTYGVLVTQDKCSAYDSINVIFSSKPQVKLGNDTILCKGGGLWLSAYYPKSTYLWSNGSTDSSIYAYNAGKYVVTVTNPCGSIKDSIYINFQGEYCDLFMANAFSPGNDWVNEVFMPKGRNIDVQLFQIFNRWGEMVFETDQNNTGWNGTYKGELVQEGLYIWKLYYTTKNGPYIKKSNAFGQVLLLR